MTKQDPGLDPADFIVLESPDGQESVIPGRETEGSAVARGSALLFSSRIVGNAGFFLAVLLLARSFSVPERGQFAFITTVAQMTGQLAGLGISAATMVFAAKRVSARGALLSNVLLFSGASSVVAATVVVGALFALDGARPLHITSVELLLMGAGAVVASLSGAATSFLTGCALWRAQSLVTALSPWFYALALGATWAFSELTVVRALIIWVALYGMMSVCLGLVAARRVPFRAPDLRLLIESLGFGVRAWVGTLSLVVNYRADQILMGFLATDAALGIYAVAVNASEVLLILPSAACTALIPTLARSEPALRVARTLRAFRALLLMSVATIIVGATCGAFLLPIVFGANYQATVVPFLILTVGTLGYVTSVLFWGALEASSLPGRGSLAPLVSLIVGLALDLALIPRYGATGAAIAASAAFLAGGLTGLLAYRTRASFAYSALIPGRADWHALGEVVNDFLHRRANRVGDDLVGDPPAA